MPSPFPGMDPYLEDPAFWTDFHNSFITYWRDWLADHLPDSYEIRMDERVNVVEVPTGRKQGIEPDLAVSRSGPVLAPESGQSAAATLEPVTLTLALQESSRETYIEILHRPNRSLVAVLELLSPANKEEPGRTAYLTKRNALLHQPVHLVEIDLLLKGRRLPIEGELPAGDYYAFIARGDRRPNCDVYAWSIRHPLPTLPIPLLAPDPDVPLSFQDLFTLTYDRGRYARSLDYAAAPPVALRPEDAAWARDLLNQRSG